MSNKNKTLEIGYFLTVTGYRLLNDAGHCRTGLISGHSKLSPKRGVSGSIAYLPPRWLMLMLPFLRRQLRW